jgi:hypothetical protein
MEFCLFANGNIVGFSGFLNKLSGVWERPQIV